MNYIFIFCRNFKIGRFFTGIEIRKYEGDNRQSPIDKKFEMQSKHFCTNIAQNVTGVTGRDGLPPKKTSIESMPVTGVTGVTGFFDFSEIAASSSIEIAIQKIDEYSNQLPESFYSFINKKISELYPTCATPQHIAGFAQQAIQAIKVADAVTIKEFFF